MPLFIHADTSLFIPDQESNPVLLVSSYIRCLISVWESFNNQAAKCCHCFRLHAKRCFSDEQLENDARLDHMEACGSTQLVSEHLQCISHKSHLQPADHKRTEFSVGGSQCLFVL
ncbi:uncharacterized [Tachysurus ichikawai]